MAAEDRADDAQRWIDNWRRKQELKTPKGRARAAQEAKACCHVVMLPCCHVAQRDDPNHELFDSILPCERRCRLNKPATLVLAK
eukprot:8650224-Pyramimonas_sp.AAC.1